MLIKVQSFVSFFWFTDDDTFDSDDDEDDDDEFHNKDDGNSVDDIYELMMMMLYKNHGDSVNDSVNILSCTRSVINIRAFVILVGLFISTLVYDWNKSISQM